MYVGCPRVGVTDAGDNLCVSSIKLEGLLLAQVEVKPNESLDSALKRFKKILQQSGILKEAKAHEHYEKPSDKRRKAEAARRRKMKLKSR